MRDLNVELSTVCFEEENLRRKLLYQTSRSNLANGHSSTAEMQSQLDEAVKDRIDIGSMICTEYGSTWDYKSF